MSGLHNSFIDSVLGYDDHYRSTEDERKMYFMLWNCCNAQPAFVLQLNRAKIVIQTPANAGELAVATLVGETLKNMCHL